MSPNANATSETNGTHADTISPSTEENNSKKREFLNLWLFTGLLVVDAVFSLVLLTPVIPGLNRARNETADHYTIYGSMLDLAVLAALRILFAVGGLIRSLRFAEDPPEYSFPLHHPNGEKKSREELEQEGLEERWGPWIWRSLNRTALGTEILSLLTEIWAVVKCLDRMNVEIGVFASQKPMHPVFWVAVLATTLFAMFEANRVDSACKLAAKYGRQNSQRRSGSPSLLRTISSTLSIPLLAGNQETVGETEGEPTDTPNGEDEEALLDERGVSDIGADAKSEATWGDLLHLCWPDIHLLFFASVFLLCAAIAQVYIPRYLGNILDALEQAFANGADDDASKHESM